MGYGAWPEAVDHVRVKPDQPFAPFVGRVLMADGPERQRLGNRLKQAIDLANQPCSACYLRPIFWRF